MLNPDTCSCCREIWNRNNLKRIPMGKHKLYLCPDCYAEYIKPFNEIVSGLEAHKWNKDEGSKAIYNSAINDAITYVEEYTNTVTAQATERGAESI